MTVQNSKNSLLVAAAMAMSIGSANNGYVERRPLYARGTNASGYKPPRKPDMNGARECARRRRQIATGILAVPYEVWNEAHDRYLAELPRA